MMTLRKANLYIFICYLIIKSRYPRGSPRGTRRRTRPRWRAWCARAGRRGTRRRPRAAGTSRARTAGTAPPPRRSTCRRRSALRQSSERLININIHVFIFVNCRAFPKKIFSVDHLSCSLLSNIYGFYFR